MTPRDLISTNKLNIVEIVDEPERANAKPNGCDRAPPKQGSKPKRKPLVAVCPLEQGQKGVSLDDFQAYMPIHSYMYTPSRELWPASSVNARIPPVPLVNADGKQC
jgi:hypothetical protein